MSKNKINIIHSRFVPLNMENVDTDQIIPARFLKGTTRDGFGKNLFRDWRYENDDEANPKSDFAAIMTCSDAEQNCPFIPNVALRIGTTYEDPKKSDGTSLQDETSLPQIQSFRVKL